MGLLNSTQLNIYTCNINKTLIEINAKGVNDDPVKGMMNQKRREIKLFFCEYNKDKVSYSDTQYRELVGMLLERVFRGFFLDLGMGRGFRKAAESLRMLKEGLIIWYV